MRKNVQVAGHVNKRMNDSVYAERRMVIDLIYKAKNLLRSNSIEMPRIDVRITEINVDSKAAGIARMNDNIIWIPASTLKTTYLYKVVLHELCHAIWGIDHNLKCKLMHTQVQLDYSNDEAEQIFLKYAKKHSGK